jgi:Zn-finger nucleic acid-binding protein
MSGRICPRCGEPLVAAKGPTLTLDVCRACGGVLFDHGELARMTQRRRDELDDVERLVEPEEPPATVTTSREMTCPICAATMETYRYAYCSGIVLDRCPECYAIWVDDGELQAIQDHLEAGTTEPKPKQDVPADEDFRVAVAQMDAKIHNAQARVRAIRAFTGRLTYRQRMHLWG